MLKVGSRPFLNVRPPPLQGGEGVQSLMGKKGCLSGPARAESPLPPIFPFEQWRLMGRERGSHGWNKAAGLEPPSTGGGCRRSCETLRLGDRNTERLANGETFAPLSGRRQDCDRPRLCSGFRGRCSCSPANFFKTSVKEITVWPKKSDTMKFTHQMPSSSKDSTFHYANQSRRTNTPQSSDEHGERTVSKCGNAWRMLGGCDLMGRRVRNWGVSI